MAAPTLTAERLRELLHYDPVTGVFTWRAPAGRWGRIPSGTIAGHKHTSGYVQINIDGVLYRAHRLAWLHVHGQWPLLGIDHKDTVRDHNWIDNLRPATQCENLQNQRKPRPSNRCGFLGVSACRRGRPFEARINVDGKLIRLGAFKTAEEASAAYLAAKARLHPFSTIQQPKEIQM